MQKKQKIGIFGSAFNPPTVGHFRALQEASRSFDEIIILPSYSHPFGKQMAPFDDRMEMTRLIIDSNPEYFKLKLSNAEQVLFSLHPNKPVYSYDVLSHFSKIYPSAELHLILGPDNSDIKTFSKFYKHKEILSQFAVFSLPTSPGARSSECRPLFHFDGKSSVDFLKSNLHLETILYATLHKL
jgi:nicotinate-nucleotide adenylyltransferase